MDGTFKSENILGGLGDDYLTMAPFGPAVPADAAKLVEARRQELIAGTAHPFRGPLQGQHGRGAGEGGRGLPARPSSRKMDWLVEGVIGQPR